MDSPLNFIYGVLQNAKQRVSGDTTQESITTLESNKKTQWTAKGIPPGTIDAALIWARRIARGYADKFPVEVREQRFIEVYPSFLEDAEKKYIKSVLESMGIETKD